MKFYSQTNIWTYKTLGVLKGKTITHLFLSLLPLVAFPGPSFANIIKSSSQNYIITTDYYTLAISKNSGMIESLKLPGSDFEIVSDYPDYSMFFPEFIAEHDDGMAGTFVHPSSHPEYLSFDVEINTPTLGIIKVSYVTRQINSYWTYIFERDLPNFRTSIKRVVEKSGVYSNAQQCVMYSADMDQSGLINYDGQFLMTMGTYSGDYPSVRWVREDVPDASPNTSPHSLWTSFDFGDPTFFPMFMWRKSSDDIIVGVITTWTSENQRASISYHGGGAGHQHPGYAEGQWNWFGKSDSESLYLIAGTTYSMELIYYQNYGPIDSLLTYNASLLASDRYQVRSLEDYRISSWGGRSTTADRYFWRYPQTTSNDLSTQRLFRHESFAIPRSQNGLRDSHLFSLHLKASIGGSDIDLAPNYGHEPLFSTLGTYQTDTSSVGTMSWNVMDISSELQYELPNQNSVIHVSGLFDLNQASLPSLDSVWIELSCSNRSNIRRTSKEHNWEFWSLDTLLDTISIIIDKISGEVHINQDSTVLNIICYDKNSINSTIYPEFSLDCTPGISKPNHLNDPSLFRSYFTRIRNQNRSENCYIEPSAKYFCISSSEVQDTLFLNLWVDETVDSIYLYSGMVYTTFVTDFLTHAKLRIEPTVKNNIYLLTGTLEPGYHILRLNDISDSSYKSALISFPNPNNGNQISFYVTSPGQENGQVTIYNLLGQKITNYRFQTVSVGYSLVQVPLNHLNLVNGIYFMVLDYFNEKQIQKLVIVQ